MLDGRTVLREDVSLEAAKSATWRAATRLNLERGESSLVDTVTRIETPEHFSLTFELAGPLRRAMAYLIDLMFRGLILLVLMWIAMLAGFTGIFDVDGMAVGAMLIVVFVLEWGYFVVLELAWDGRSVGKRILGLRVVSADGRPLGAANVLLRNLLRAADFLPNLYALGFLVMATDRKFRRLGDAVAGTLVIYERKDRIDNALFINPPPTQAELALLPQRPDLSGRDLEALEVFLRRMPQYPDARLLELAELIAPAYARRVGVRYRSPVRFLAVLYHRAAQLGAAQPRSLEGVTRPMMQPSQTGWAPGGGPRAPNA